LQIKDTVTLIFKHVKPRKVIGKSYVKLKSDRERGVDEHNQVMKRIEHIIGSDN